MLRRHPGEGTQVIESDVPFGTDEARVISSYVITDMAKRLASEKRES